MKNLIYIPKSQELEVDMHTLMEMIRDIDINQTKMMFTETYGNLYVG